jgi:hypothetical protein
MSLSIGSGSALRRRWEFSDRFMENTKGDIKHTISLVQDDDPPIICSCSAPLSARRVLTAGQSWGRARFLGRTICNAPHRALVLLDIRRRGRSKHPAIRIRLSRCYDCTLGPSVNSNDIPAYGAIPSSQISWTQHFGPVCIRTVAGPEMSLLERCPSLSFSCHLCTVSKRPFHVPSPHCALLWPCRATVISNAHFTSSCDHVTFYDN